MAIYDESWNLVTSSDNYEMALYSSGCNGSYNPWCQYSRTTDKTQAPVPPVKLGHSHTILVNEPVLYDPNVRTERKQLPHWFSYLAKRAGSSEFIKEAVSPESAKQGLVEGWAKDTAAFKARVENGQETWSDGKAVVWGDNRLMWQIFPPSNYREEKRFLVSNFVSYEKVYLRPTENTQPPENLAILSSVHQTDSNPAFHQFYEFAGDLYNPILKDDGQWYESSPEDEEQIFYICTAGVYSPLYAAFREVIRFNSASYLVLLMFYILFLLLCIFVEYRSFGAVQQRTIQSQRDLLVTVAHELKTPMGVVMLYGEKIELDSDAATMKQYAHTLREEIKRMNNRLMDVLAVSRLDNMPTMSTETIALDELLEDVCDEFLPLVEEKGITLQAEIPPDVAVEANAFYARVAVHNFLSNAVKFTPSGGRIALQLARTRKAVRVSVFNSGSRIEAKDEKKVWGNFYTANNEADNKNKGTGLGLSIVQSIIQLHEGICGLRNQADGVEFWFELPLKQKRKRKKGIS
ncbi:MAG: HAMP domain-containing histidine kinase [Oscillospiraceae bacterium]|nr:HAMP domain-containing histidine kinase [Oscillospiraceae bacterium]